MKILNKISILAVAVSSLLASGIAIAQNKILKVGDQVPNIALSEIINYPSKSADISSFRGRLLILDFWTTHCTPCIAAFPKIDSLQREYGDRLAIMPITSEKSPIVKDMLQKVKNNFGVTIPSIVSDTKLHELFFHRTVPHCVWINGNGQVIAITDGTSLNRQNIDLALKREGLGLKTKIDNPVKQVNFSKSIFSVNIPTIDQNKVVPLSLNDDKIEIKSILTKNLSFLQGYIGMSSNKITILNNTIGGLYKTAFLKDPAAERRLSVEIPDSIIYRQISTNYQGRKIVKSGRDAELWLLENGWCYELTVPSNMSDQKFEIMQQQLNLYFGQTLGIKGRVEKRLIDVLVLKQIGSSDLLKTKGGEPVCEFDKFSFNMINNPISEMVRRFKYIFQTLPPVIDETNIEAKVDIKLTCNLSKLDEVNQELKKYGLQFFNEKRQQDICVITYK